MAFISIILISSSAFYSCTFILHVIFCISNLPICSEMLFTQLSPCCRLTVAVQLQWKARDIQVTSLFLCAGEESRQKKWGELCLQAASFFFQAEIQLSSRITEISLEWQHSPLLWPWEEHVCFRAGYRWCKGHIRRLGTGSSISAQQ